ncbi:MAG: hypothetical protein IJ783_11585 [Kiritimatiellae bacterium]|nr:hypothetical protein [Kiritimatiellia bacterium]
MTAAAILEALAEEIRRSWASAHRCRVSVAPDPARALELLAAGAPEGCALTLYFEGEEPADDRGLVCDEQLAGRFSLALLAHPGMREREAAPGALALAEDLRRFLLREASGEGLLDGWRYAGMQSFNLSRGDAPLGGYTLTLTGVYDCGDEEETQT